jgi:branched-subunit amino acid transport protein
VTPTTGYVLAAIACLVVATFVTRAGFLLLGERLTLSRRVDAALRFAPACALTALVVPGIVSPEGALDLSLGNPRWLAALVATAFLLWRHSVLGGIAVGMIAYALIRLWLL